MITVSNIEEFTISTLKQFADMFENGFAPYSYVFENEYIKIKNPDMETVLSITTNTISIRDVIQEAIDEIVYKESLEVHNQSMKQFIDSLTSLSTVDSISMSFLANQLNYLSMPLPTYKTYQYFNTEEQTFQQYTKYDDVLSYETAVHINKIKSAVIEDLKRKWVSSE